MREESGGVPPGAREGHTRGGEETMDVTARRQPYSGRDSKLTEVQLESYRA